jgi:hypothetical protein
MASPFVVEGGYFGRKRFEGAEERDGRPEQAWLRPDPFDLLPMQDAML